ncbi:MAG: hypothetical protein HQL81_06760, partial [Magnetococcales bacterium]|nr:hypothetical protein [Magnetococcales bacterium]
QLWLYSDKRHEFRRKLWLQILSVINNSKDIHIVDPKILFDFHVGRYEIFPDEPMYGLNTMHSLSDIQNKRLELAPFVWSENGKKIINRNDLSIELLDVGWEAISAKVVLDDLMDSVKNNSRDKIIEKADRSVSLARLAGTFRREIKAEVIKAMWSDAQDGRILLLNCLHSLHNRTIEPSLREGIVTGLLACFSSKKYGKSDITAHLNECGVSDVNALSFSNLNYWAGFSPEPVKIYLNYNINKLEGK